MRSRGISHNPAEHVDPADADAGARVLLRLIENFRPGGVGVSGVDVALAYASDPPYECRSVYDGSMTSRVIS